MTMTTIRLATPVPEKYDAIKRDMNKIDEKKWGQMKEKTREKMKGKKGMRKEKVKKRKKRKKVKIKCNKRK